MSIKNIKVSIVTVVKNGMPYLEDCIKSYQIQDYKNKELIVVYSNSQDRTYTFLKKQKHITKLIIDKRSKNKFGALNVGLQNTTGDIIGLLHSDDIFASTKVLSNVAKIYQETNFDISYSDIKFCLRNNLLAIRRAWISSNYNFKKMQLGWMPPHVSIFISKKYKNIAYRTCYPISGDYDYILRIFKKASNIVYTNYVSVIMRLGGVSNKFIFKKTKEDLLIAKNHLGNIYIFTIFFKNLIKIPQLLKGKFEFKYKYSQYIKKNYTPSIFIIDNIKKILQRKKFFLCARNLAFYSLVINKLNVLRKDIIFWQDGMFPFNTHIKKLPGRDLLAKLHPNKKINKIYLLSKKNKKNFKYVIKKFKNTATIIQLDLPFANTDSIIKRFSKFKVHVDNKTLFLIAIPTPKQEILGSFIMNRFDNAKVVCAGGALDYLSGNISKPLPIFSSKLEFLWRLRNDFRRRSYRLVLSCIFLIKNYFSGEFYELNIKNEK